MSTSVSARAAGSAASGRSSPGTSARCSSRSASRSARRSSPSLIPLIERAVVDNVIVEQNQRALATARAARRPGRGQLRVLVHAPVRRRSLRVRRAARPAHHHLRARATPRLRPSRPAPHRPDRVARQLRPRPRPGAPELPPPGDRQRRAARAVAGRDARAVAAAHAVIVLAIVPALLFVSLRLRRVMFPAQWDSLQRAGEVAGVVDEAVNGVRVVKGFGQEDRELRRPHRRRRGALPLAGPHRAAPGALPVGARRPSPRSARSACSRSAGGSPSRARSASARSSPSPPTSCSCSRRCGCSPGWSRSPSRRVPAPSASSS